MSDFEPWTSEPKGPGVVYVLRYSVIHKDRIISPFAKEWGGEMVFPSTGYVSDWHGLGVYGVADGIISPIFREVLSPEARGVKDEVVFQTLAAMRDELKQDATQEHDPNIVRFPRAWVIYTGDEAGAKLKLQQRRYATSKTSLVEVLRAALKRGAENKARLNGN